MCGGTRVLFVGFGPVTPALLPFNDEKSTFVCPEPFDRDINSMNFRVLHFVLQIIITARFVSLRCSGRYKFSDYFDDHDLYNELRTTIE